MLDVTQLRKDFPLLGTLSNKKPLCYLDSAASSIKPTVVIEAEAAYYREYGVNIHRGLYAASAKATRRYQETREQVARFIKAPDPRSIIFTRGSTESSNLVAYAWARQWLRAGDRVLSTQLEHHSTLVPWQEACRRHQATLDFIPYDTSTGELDLSGLDALLAGARVLVITGMANATGYKPPLDIIIPAARRHGVTTVVDAAQLAAHSPVDVQDLDCDFLYFSGHKLLGPTGVGVLYGRASILEAMEPWMFGGDMIAHVGDTESTWADIPEKFEAGTPNIGGVLGFSAALDYLSAVGMEAIQAHEAALDAYVLQRLSTYPGLDRYGPQDPSRMRGMLSFNLTGIHSHDTATILDAQGIAVRAGFHCAMPYLRLLGTSGTVRASFYLYTGTDDIDRLFAALDQAKAVFA